VTPAVLIVSPAINSKGTRATSVRGLLFDAHLDGRLIVGRSTQPMLDGARRLLDEGYDPATPLVMRHAGASYASLRSTVGAAAKLTVRESTGKPSFTDWKPWNGDIAGAVTSPMRETVEGCQTALVDEGALEADSGTEAA
jgi:hypothetical protein